MVSNIQIQNRKRSAHQQVIDWLASEELACDLKQASITHWRIGPFACCVVILHKNMKSCSIAWSDWVIGEIAGKYPDQDLYHIVSVKNRHDLRILQKKYGFLINRSRSSSYLKIQNLLREKAIPADPFKLADQIIL